MRYQFTGSLLNVEERVFERAGHPFAIAPQIFDLLVYLIRNRDRVIPRAELVQFLWPDVFVSDWALSKCVGRLRQAIGDTDRTTPVVRTHHGRGFRFVAAIEAADEGNLAERVTALTLGEATSAVRIDSAADAPRVNDARHDGLAGRDGADGIANAGAWGTVATGEWHKLTVLCANLIPSRRCTEAIDAGGHPVLKRRCHEAVEAVVNAAGGYVGGRFGTRLMVYFGYPHPHRDHAARAVRAGREIVAAIERLGDEAGNAGAAALTVQVGIHTGWAVIDDLFLRGMALGTTVSVARALHREAPAGGVLVSEATRESAGRIQI